MKKVLFIIPFFLWTCGGGGSTEPELPQLPTVQNINLEGVEDTPITFTFLGTDPQNLSLTYNISTKPENGNVTINNSVGTYTPNANYNGSDTFYYLASNSGGNSNIGTVVINIAEVDDQPNSMDVNVTTDEDNSVSITLQAEEYDGDNIEFNITGNPSNGTVTLTGTNATYTPNQDWNGTDTFNFEAVDNNNRSILNNAIATIIVNPINDAPTIEEVNDIELDWNNFIDITLNASDVEDDEITFEIVTNPSKGTVVSTNHNNIVRYYADGDDSGQDYFTFKAYDGELYSDTKNVNVFVSDGYIYFDITSSNDQSYDSIVLNNNIIHAGYSYDGSTMSALLLETDDEGNKLSEQVFNNGIYLHSINETSDGGLVASGVGPNSILAIMKLDSNLQEVWTEEPDLDIFEDQTQGGQFYEVIEINQGEHIAAGHINDSVGEHFTVVKLDNAGSVIWAKKLMRGEARSVIQSTSNNGFLVGGRNHIPNVERGSYIIKIDNDGNIVWELKIEDDGSSGFYVEEIIILNDGNYAAVSNNSIHIIDDNGNIINSTVTSEGNGAEYNNKGIIQTSSGELVIAGYLSWGIYDHILIEKYDLNLNLLWHKTNLKYCCSEYSEIFLESIVELDNGNLVVSGSIEPNGNRSYDIFIYSTDSSGNRIF
tara:strand:- start:2583 stop:4544 length:1962 start_codon:yes stop_codon:yes gene_type:complete